MIVRMSVSDGAWVDGREGGRHLRKAARPLHAPVVATRPTVMGKRADICQAAQDEFAGRLGGATPG